MNVRDGHSFKYYPKLDAEGYEDFVEKNMPKWLGRVAMAYAIKHGVSVEDAVRWVFVYFCVLQDLVYYRHNVEVGELRIEHGNAMDTLKQRLEIERIRGLLVEENYPSRRSEIASKLVQSMVKEAERVVVKKPLSTEQIERIRRKMQKYNAERARKMRREKKNAYIWGLINENC